MAEESEEWGRVEEVLQESWPRQETLMAQDCVELWAMVGHPPCPPLHPYQHGQERNSTPLSCII